MRLSTRQHLIPTSALHILQDTNTIISQTIRYYSYKPLRNIRSFHGNLKSCILANAAVGATVFFTAAGFDETNATSFGGPAKIHLEGRWKGIHMLSLPPIIFNTITHLNSWEHLLNPTAGTADCAGSISVRKCTLRAGEKQMTFVIEIPSLTCPGIRRYPVVFSNNSIALVDGFYYNDTFLGHTNISMAKPGGRSTLGGLAFSVATIL